MELKQFQRSLLLDLSTLYSNQSCTSNVRETSLYLQHLCPNVIQRKTTMFIVIEEMGDYDFVEVCVLVGETLTW
jgi:hypothetical protein